MASGTGGVAYLNAEDGKLFDGSANKLKGKKFVYGNQGATRLDLVPALAWDMLGMDVKHDGCQRPWGWTKDVRIR